MDAFTWLVFAVIVLLVYWVRSRRETGVTEGRLPPGSMGLPFIGNSIEFARKKVEFFREGHKRYGKIFKASLFGKSVIRLYGSENIRTIIQGENKIVQSSYPTSVKKLLGSQSISQSHGDVHKTNKRNLMKFLCPEFFTNHTPVIAQLINDRIGSWTEKPAIDLYQEIKRLFIELSARFLINIDISDDNITKLIEQLDIFTDNIFCLPVYLPGFGYYKALNAKYAMRKIIKDAMTQSENNNETDELSSVLQRLAAGSGEPEGSNVLVDTIIDLLFSGSQTVASAGCTLAHKLCTSSEIRDRVQADINDQSLNDSLESICLDDVIKMKYVNAVVKETLRLAPPVGGAYRTVLETFTLDGYTIPKGWSVVFSIRETQLNDTEQNDVDRFNPERWLKSEEGNSRYAFLPFGAGTRSCPGQSYAKMVLKLFTTEFVRSCSPTLIQDSEFISFPSPKPRDQILIKVDRK